MASASLFIVAASALCPPESPAASSIETVQVELRGDPPRWTSALNVSEAGTYVIWLDGAQATESCSLVLTKDGDDDRLAMTGGRDRPLPFARLEWDGLSVVTATVEASERGAELSLVVRRTSDDATAVAIAERLAPVIVEWEAAIAAGERVSRDAIARWIDQLDGLDPMSEAGLRAAGDLGDAALEAGYVDLALAAYEPQQAALQLLRPRDHEDAMRADSNLALALLYSGRFEEAASRFQSLYEVRERLFGPDDARLVSVRLNLGAALASAGRTRESITHFEYVLERRRAEPGAGASGLARPMVNLAQARLQIGDLGAARRLLGDVVSMTEGATGPLAVEGARASIALSGVEREAGDHLAACLEAERGLGVLEALLPEDHPFVTSGRTSLALALRGLGELEEACAIFEQLVESAARTHGSPSVKLHRARYNLAVTRLASGASEGALEEIEALLSEEGEATQSLDQHPERLATRFAHGEALRAVGRRVEARAVLEEVLDGYRTLGVRTRAELGLLSNLLEFAVEEGDRKRIDAAIDALLPALHDHLVRTMRTSSREASAVLRDVQPSIALALHSTIRGDRARERALFELVVLAREVTAIGPRVDASLLRDPELAEAVRAVARARGELGDALAAGRFDPRDDAGERVRTAIAARDRAEARVAETLEARGVRTPSASVDSLAASLAEGDALVVYLQHSGTVIDEETGRPLPGPARLTAFVLSRTGEPVRLDLGAATEIEALADRWRVRVFEGSTRGIEPVDPGDRESDRAIALRAALLDPVLEALEGNVERLSIVADGPVHLIPLDALPATEGLVGDELTVIVRPRLSSAGDRVSSGTGAAALTAVGAIEYDAAPTPSEAGPALPTAAAPSYPRTDSSRLGFLIQSRVEVETLQALHAAAFDGAESRILTGVNVDKESLSAAVRGAEFVHLATHGWFAGDALASSDPSGRKRYGGPVLDELVVGFAPAALCGLALSGANHGRDDLGRVPGILSAEELAVFDLSACELAVLSACETSVGIRRAGQGIESLRTAIHAAGARRAITSLWRVDDAAARRLFERFYTLLWLDGHTVPDALWKARMELRAEGYPVRDWAGWVLSTIER
ncbi:MAG: CHAT domain-containing tetratricopeptide repeat protein [Planctomycetota bacterium]